MERGLRDWVERHDTHVRAAVLLLIEQDVWLRRPAFVKCVKRGEVGWWINFHAARRAFDADEFLPASSTQLAILDLAIALGEGRYRLNFLGGEHAAMVLRAVAEAVGRPDLLAVAPGAPAAPVVLVDPAAPAVDQRPPAQRHAERVTELCLWALEHNDGRPNAAWSDGQRLAVALVLDDEAYLREAGWSRTDAVAWVVGGMQIPPGHYAEWVIEIRSRLRTAGWDAPRRQRRTR